MVVNLLALICVLLAGVYCYIKPPLRRTGPFLPDSAILGVLIYALGSYYSVAYRNIPNAPEVAEIALLALASMLFGATLFVLIPKLRLRYRDTYAERLVRARCGENELRAVFLGSVLCVLIMVVFIAMVFRNDAVGALLSVASFADGGSFLDARKLITSGQEGYFAPGYIKQFRDILAPIFLVSLQVHIGLYQESRLRKILWLGLFGITLIAMLITGQRMILLILILATTFTKISLSRYRLSSSRKGSGFFRNVLLVVVLMTVYGLVSFLLGRVSDGQGVGFIFSSLLERIFLASPGENMKTYPFWSDLGPTYGQSWLGELALVLPGVDGMSFHNMLHSLNGGSEAGNSPLALPADVWLAWGYGGVLIVPCLYIVFVGFVDASLSTSLSPVLQASKIYLFIVLPIIFSPYGFLLYGGAAVLLLLFMISFLRGRMLSIGAR